MTYAHDNHYHSILCTRHYVHGHIFHYLHFCSQFPVMANVLAASDACTKREREVVVFVLAEYLKKQTTHNNQNIILKLINK